MSAKRILITGAAGYLGLQLGHRLMDDFYLLGLDVRGNPTARFPIEQMDIRSPNLQNFIAQHRFSHVVHLASVVAPSNDSVRDYDIDVNGTRNLLAACATQGIKHITVTSSGAAYGYHADSPAQLRESDPLRGNTEFSYAYHKREVEALLTDYRLRTPQLAQLIFRPGTVLGQHTDNLITRLFTGSHLIAIAGSDSPFVFIWDQDVLAAIEQGIRLDSAGIYNLAGDGALSMAAIARRLGKPLISLPAWLVRTALAIGHSLGATRYDPSQVNFLRYRPVLDNRALKQDFGYTPQKTSAQVFDYFIAHHINLTQAKHREP
ncbi:SDR family oxidoreductase [Simiduia aestuariiviva]|uniref:UDP-glucose 4-epimerase n=1 Tax=Simiduia aestuariiviva TaxID=1510459 RepID=A0A839UMD7_9GAMM|nr:SDR family oxidoreductase [Simiduia aestuariiviva]MBB3167709.1 UDP-glucose 4-epimerase [Simiduia aestuariiviva]